MNLLKDAKSPTYPDYSNQSDEPSVRWHDLRSFVWETIKVIIISLAIILPVRYWLIQPFYVQGASMEPSFLDQEYLIIDEISYRFEPPQRGDIVVFRYPRDPKQFFIKRIIGLPGEQVQIANSQIKILNDMFPEGVDLDESAYVLAGVKTTGNLRVSLQDNEYYVLGDNRAFSLDSRGFGPITTDMIVGKVWLRGWPANRAGVIRPPGYDI